MAELQNHGDDLPDIKNKVKSFETTKLSKAIKAANELVAPLILPENSCYAMDSLLKARLKEYILEPDEQLLFLAKQSKLNNLVPKIFVFTDKKIITGQPSILHFLGIKSLAYTGADLIKYTEIRDLSIKRGLHLRSLFIKIPGSEPMEIRGMSSENADLILKFVMKIVEYLEG